MLRLSENMRAALFMMASMAGYALNDAFVKSTAGELNLFQAIFLRGIVATVLILLLAQSRGGLRHRPSGRDRLLLAWRSVGEIGATFCFLTALFHMPLANATAILQSVPLAVALGAALFLGEPVGWRRYLAIGAGFLGVLVIVRPGGEGFNAYSLSALGAVAFITLRDLTTRRFSPGMPSLYVTMLASLSITSAAGAASVVEGWRPIALAPLGALSLAALSIVVGYIFGVMTMRTGSIGFTQPFRYSLLPWAILFGFLFFSEVPDIWMLGGSALVIATGLFTFHRERAAARTATALHPGAPPAEASASPR